MINLVDNELICKSLAGRFSRLGAELNIVFPKVTMEVLSKYFFYVTVFYLKPQRMRRASDDV